MLLILYLFSGYVLSIEGSCVIEELPKTIFCRGMVNCDQTTKGLIDFLKGNWPCIKTVRNRYNYNNYGYYDNSNNIVYSSDYELTLNVRDIDINVSEDPLVGLTGDAANNVKNLTVSNGNLVSIPIQIYSLRSLTNLVLIHNEIESIDLVKLSHMYSLQTLNFSHNAVLTVESQEETESRNVSPVSSIDLSYNKLVSLADNCFTPFINLKYLDLTNNIISELDILTFEGITQLETLYLSNNKLTEIGHNFARFVNLKHFTLDHNYLTTLTEFEFKKFVSLRILDLSSNRIKNIEDRTFFTLRNLQELDLSDNQITNIHKSLLESNVFLSSLLLSNNCIETIEGGTFIDKNITVFDIRNNNLNGSVESVTFQGIYVDNLDLSNEKLTEIGDRAFSSMSSTLSCLNLSMNNIYSIANTSFNSLELLLKLDLSNNKLTDLEFDTSDLKSLTEYYLHNNRIKKIQQEMFKSLASLIKLDLSWNSIIDIDLNSFVELENLESLMLYNNPLINSVEARMFDGLHKLNILDISKTKIISFKNESFSGLISTIVNCSHSEIEKIEYESFKGSGVIKIIDFSNNMLENFSVNTSHLHYIRELYLDHNKLRNITKETFYMLYSLEKLSLAYNNIINLDSKTFQTISHLKHLKLDSNVALAVKDNTLDDLSLSEVSLIDVKGKMSFKNTHNTSVITLNLRYCNIGDVNSVHVFELKNVLKLDMSFNSITMLDKGSFQKMPVLNWLDLSFNRISFIQPGTFLLTNMINTLNLHGNNLMSVQFGVLDGLSNIRVLNLSSNAINVFDANLLHSTPFLSDLYLDNNIIKSIGFRDFLKSSIKLLSIGGNLLSCYSLININEIIRNDSFIITAENLDYNMENIHGVTCKTDNTQETVKNVTSDTNMNEIARELHAYLNISKTMSNTLDNIKMDLDRYATVLPESVSKVQAPIDKISTSFSVSHEKLLNAVGSESGKLAEILKSITSLLEVSNNFTEMTNQYLKEQNNTIHKKEDIINVKQDFIPKGAMQYNILGKSDKYDMFDIRVALYIICACLAIIVMSHVISFAHTICRRKVCKQNTPLTSYACSLEME